MELTPLEAFDLLRTVGDRLRYGEGDRDALLAQRRTLVGVLDGQEGMSRIAMAHALGISVPRIQQLVAAHRGHLADINGEVVLMPDALRKELEALDLPVPTHSRRARHRAHA